MRREKEKERERERERERVACRKIMQVGCWGNKSSKERVWKVRRCVFLVRTRDSVHVICTLRFRSSIRIGLADISRMILLV